MNSPGEDRIRKGEGGEEKGLLLLYFFLRGKREVGGREFFEDGVWDEYGMGMG